MADRNLKALRTEVLRFGPSPFVPNKEGPILILFHNELESVVGTAETDVFGKPASAFLIITTFRIVLYKWNKRGDDEVHSYWFHIDCSDKPFHDEEGFLIAGVETSSPEYSVDESNNKPFLTWETSYINPDGDKKIAESVKIYPVLYNHHQENRYVDVRETISIPGYTPDGKESYPALMPFIVKFYAVRRGPMGRLKMIDLKVMHQSPEAATILPAGEVPDDCELHESKATRPRTSYNVKSKIKKGTSKKTKPSQKKEDKKPALKWKKAASTALDVGSKLKGGLDVIGKAASAAAASGVESIKEISEKGAETIQKTGESIRETAQETLAEKAVSAGSSVGICATCGTPMRSGSLFCGKCGQKVADRVVEEVKDHIKGKAEDLAVGKAKAMLDEEQEKSAGPKKSATNPKQKTTQKTHKLSTKCPHCGEPVKSGWKFCPGCSQPLPLTCPQCGKEVQPDWKFCPQCTNALTNPQTGGSR